MKSASSLCISILFIFSSAMADDNCNSILSDRLQSSIHDLAKLRLDLDSKIASGDSHLIIRSLENEFDHKRAELSDVKEIDERLKDEVAKLQGLSRAEETAKKAIAKQQEEEFFVSKTKIELVKNFDLPRKDHGALMIAPDQILSFGGREFQADGSDLVESYNPQTGEIFEVARMIKPRIWMSLLPRSDKKIAIIGGVTGNDRATTIEIFDPGSKKIEQFKTELDAYDATITPYAIGQAIVYHKANSPILLFDAEKNSVDSFAQTDGRRDQSFSLLSSKKLVVSGGREYMTVGPDDTYYNEVIVVDPTLKTKVTAGRLLENRWEHAQVTLKDDTVLFIGGKTDDSKPLSTIERFDFSTGKSTVVGQLYECRTKLSTVLLDDGRIVIIGYRFLKGKFRSPVEIFDPTTNELLPVGYLNEYRHDAQVVASGDVIYVIGGMDNDFKPLSSIEKIEVGKR